MVALERTIERANRACDLDFHIRQQVSTHMIASKVFKLGEALKKTLPEKDENQPKVDLQQLKMVGQKITRVNYLVSFQ